MILRKQIKTLPHDPFIRRVRSTTIGEGMLHDGNIYLMNYALEKMPLGGAVVEIGLFAGLSTSVMIYLLDKLGRTESYFNCDAWIYQGYNDSPGTLPDDHMDGRPDIKRVNYAEYVKNAYVNAMHLLCSHRLPNSFHMSSDAFFELWHKKEHNIDIFGKEVQLGSSISMAYIDGDHSLAQTQKDFENVSSHLLPGGFILFDDSADVYSFGSASFMKTMKKNEDYILINKNPNYLFQKKKV